ncbi:MAG: hypothetical protein LLF76_09520 [Planctomycetaceae bacterium]|nr:hypothetical protein [Planctomycetaceae bacterium]
MKSPIKFIYIILACGFACCVHAAPLDTIVFGNTSSEMAHGLLAISTQSFSGALGESARRCLPLDPIDYYGGSLTFIMTVDPVRRNYFTVKLWSDDDDASLGQARGRLYLYVPDGGTDYQVGFRHEGDYMPLSVGRNGPGLTGRFFYSTTLLPLEMTLGKTSLTLKIVSTGRLYGLGQGGEKDGGNYQFLMDVNSRGIYRAYTHVDPFLNPTGETQGTAPTTTVRPSPGAEVLAPGGSFHNNVTNWINNRLSQAASTSFSTGDAAYLARAYSVSQVTGYHNSAIVSKVRDVVDAYAAAYYGGTISPSGWGGGWGSLGHAIHLLSTPLSSQFDTVVDYGAGGSLPRRQAWGDLLYASREAGRLGRRTLSNQNFIADTDIYLANKGLLVLSDARAFAENDAQRYLREACGLSPWLGSDLSGGGGAMPFGASYYQVTTKGLTREWGYVGKGYGEMALYPALYYRLTGNIEFRDQAIKMSRARAAFRRPGIEISGSSRYRTMEFIGLLAWRSADESDGEFGNEIGYADRVVSCRGLRVAAATGDAMLIGYAKQMLNDNQYFSAILSGYKAMEALDVFDDYNTIMAAADSGARLPMTDDQPDFGWADEENRILALKHGNDRLWITPYWQAKYGTGINGIARFQFSTTNYTQYGVLETVPQFTLGGTFTRTTTDIDKPEGFQWWPPEPRPLQAYGNEILPLGPTPADASNSDPFRGKAEFYAFRFGHYLVGLNASEEKSFTLKTPAGFSSAQDLISGTTLNGPIVLAPKSTVALYLPDAVDAAPVPMTPLYLNVSNGIFGVDLAWTASSGASAYIVKRSFTLGGPYFDIAVGLTNPAYSDNTVGMGQTYYYVVTATNANGESYPSCERCITAATTQNIISFNIVPSGNTTMYASHYAGAPGVRVNNWNMFNGDTLSFGIVNGAGQPVSGMSVSLATAYNISDRGGSIGDDVSMFRTVLDQFNGSASTLTITGVPFARYDLYFYVLADENSGAANDRGGSFTVGITTYYIRTGSATRVTATDGTGYLLSDDTTFGTGMDVELGNYVKFTNLSDNLTATMIAENINGGALRLKVSGFQIVNQATPLAAPTGLTAAACDQAVSLDWNDNPEPDIMSYKIWRAASAGGPYTLIASDLNASNHTDNTVSNGTRYFYVVTAVNRMSDESAGSNEVTAIHYSGDLTCNGSVNMEDLAELGSQWQTGYTLDSLLSIAQDWLKDESL